MKHSWEEKLGQEGLQYVEVSAKLRRIRQPSTLGRSELRRFFKEQREVLSAYPDLGAKRKVKVDARFVRAYLQANPDFESNEEEMLEMFEDEEFPVLRAEELELHQRIFLNLESDQNKRFQAYGAVASGITLLRRLFSGAFKKQLGTKQLTLFKMFTAVAQNLEWVGTLLRGKGNLREPPGRVNVELANVVNMILKHQKESLSQLEIYAAVKAAGGEVQEDPEAFRLWLHRAVKDGIVKNYRSSRTKTCESSKNDREMHEERS
jgi:DNA polymerase elongation subunit (family B)